MDLDKYLSLMRYPKEWVEWDLLPDQEYMHELIALYEPGHEDASEHDRNGVFHWWLRKDPAEEILIKLAMLTFLDPDPDMAKDVRSYIKKAKNYNENVEAALKDAI